MAWERFADAADHMRHFTEEELEGYRRRAVKACCDYELAKQHNAYLTAYGIERVSVESWSTRLSRKLAKPFQVFPMFSVRAE